MNPLFLDYNVNHGGVSEIHWITLCLGVLNILVLIWTAISNRRHDVKIKELEKNLGTDAYREQRNYDRDTEQAREVILRVNAVIGQIADIKLKMIMDAPDSLLKHKYPNITPVAELMIWFDQPEKELLGQLQTLMLAAHRATTAYAKDPFNTSDEVAMRAYDAVREHCKVMIEHFKKLHREGLISQA
ncbi:MAG TPA: hypothetical protein PL070_01115 [Flavobacteriales bacterium]|nr:hypothetical protein [Flavobacteriales bacterium]